MKEPVYIKLFLDYLDAVDALSDVERGRLFTALLKYGRTGEAPQLTGNERFIFPLMKAQIDRDFAAWREKDENTHEARQEAGRKGGLARASKLKQIQANQANASKPKQIKHRTKTTDNDEGLLTNGKDDSSPPIPPDGGTGENVPVSDSEKPKSPSKPKKPEEPKISYADFVTMTETEHQKLVEKYGEVKTARMIEILNNYKGSTGKKYVSDYLTCLNWVAERVEQERQRNGAYQGGYGNGGGYDGGNGGAYAAYAGGVPGAAFGGNAGQREMSPEERWGDFKNW